MGCERIFIASDYPLPLIEYDPGKLDFWVGGFDETVRQDDVDEEVRRLFTKPFIYYVGSHLGCGCGFAYYAWEACDFSIWREDKELEEPELPEEQYRRFWEEYINNRTDEEIVELRKHYEEGHRSVQQLRDYLSAATAQGPVELYVRWGDDPIREPIHRETVTPRFFGGTSFTLNPIHEALLTVWKTGSR